MTVRLENRGAVAWITIDRPDVLNALDIPHLEDLLARVEQAANDAAAAVLVITGAGRAFCVGADIKAMGGMTDAEFETATQHYQSLAATLRGLDKPVIAAVNGYALGGGLEIALMCDLRIAAAAARLGLPDAELGFSPSGGLTYLLPRIVGEGRAKHLLLTAEPVDAAEAERIGLVTMVTDDAALVDTTMATAERLAGCPRTGLANTKRGMAAASDADFADALVVEAVLDAACYRDDETRARLAAFLAARKR